MAISMAVALRGSDGVPNAMGLFHIVHLFGEVLPKENLEGAEAGVSIIICSGG